MSRNTLGRKLRKASFMLTCQETSELVSQSLDNPLSFTARLKLKFHLMMCSACHRFNRQLWQLRRAILGAVNRTEHDTSITLSPEAKTKIRHTLANEISKHDAS